ncbi:MAG: trigger factor [Candidatus Riflebacteria bacterium]|nr:trigger factor [Candidatus Riflebacteria bacterium]
MLKTQVQELEPNKVALLIEVDKEKVQQAYTSFFQRAAHSVNIPGFRRGKIPRPVLIQHIGPENIRGQIEEELVQEVYPVALREMNIHPVSHMKLEESSLKEGQAFTFKAVVEVRPKLPEFSYTGRSVRVKRAQVNEDSVQKVLENLAEQFSKTVPVEDGVLDVGDYFLAKIDVACEGKRDEELSEARAYRKFTESEILKPALGMKPGETRVFSRKVEDEAQKDSKYFGRTLDYTFALDRISRPKLPQINDDFAKEVGGEYKTLEELKAKIREDLAERSRGDAEESAIDALVKQISEQTTFSVPDAMIQHTIDFFLRDIDRRWRQYGTSLADYIKNSGKNIKEYREAFRDKATLQTRVMLIIDAIAEREKVIISDAEYRNAVEKQAGEYGMPVEKLLETLAKSDGEENIRHSLISQKIGQFLLKNNQVDYDMVSEAELKEGEPHGDASTDSN